MAHTGTDAGNALPLAQLARQLNKNSAMSPTSSHPRSRCIAAKLKVVRCVAWGVATD